MHGRTALRLHSLSRKIDEAVGLRQRNFIPPIVLGVCGGSGSGKSTFCELLVSLLGPERVAYLRQDDYYKDLSHLALEERIQTNFDHPDSIEFALLTTHLDFLTSGREIAVPRYDFGTHLRTSIQQIVSPRPIVLVDGILLLADANTTTRLQHKIFIDASESVRFQRRMKRDSRERGRTPESIENQFNSTVRPMHDLYVEAKKSLADRIISGEAPFEPVLFDLCASLMREIDDRGSSSQSGSRYRFLPR